MANTAALLGTLLCTNADINYYTQQSIYWNAKYEANLAKLNEQVKYHEKWEMAFDSAIDNTKELTAGSVRVAANNKNEMLADAYADAKVKHYDEELSLELADLDIEYDTMKTMYDTLLEELRAKEEAEKSATSDAASDTGLLNQ
jgi:hypothetical protein